MANVDNNKYHIIIAAIVIHKFSSIVGDETTLHNNGFTLFIVFEILLPIPTTVSKAAMSPIISIFRSAILMCLFVMIFFFLIGESEFSEVRSVNHKPRSKFFSWTFFYFYWFIGAQQITHETIPKLPHCR